VNAFRVHIYEMIAWMWKQLTRNGESECYIFVVLSASGHLNAQRPEDINTAAPEASVAQKVNPIQNECIA